MELDQLRTFAVIARLGSLSAASEAVNLSQPAVSRQVQALERRLGAKLLERGARGVQLTEAGTAVARGAADVLARLEELEAELALLRGGEGGTVRVGATVTVCLYLLPPLLRRFRERYPRQEIILINERSRQIPELVRDRRIDVGIASSSAPPPGVRRVPWRELSLVLLGTADHSDVQERQHEDPNTPGARVSSLPTTPLVSARRDENSPLPLPAAQPQRLGPGPHDAPSAPPAPAPEHLNAHPAFVLSTPGSLRSLTEQVLAREGIEPRVVAEADSLEVVKRLVLDGFGRAIVPAICVTEDDRVAGLRAFPLPDEAPRLPVVLWLRDGPYLPPAVRNFLALAGEA